MPTGRSGKANVALRGAVGEAPSMALTRTVRSRGSSLVVAIPHDLARMMDWRPGQVVEFESVGRDALLIRAQRSPPPA
jgi:bifunctional DNA-binding transcriptional regulator/antitoxin component of YhaV-PrlF toxin-antitoxin module